MKTTAQSQKMVIISDLHIGNPFSNAKQRVINFLNWASENKYDICINGDGLEIAQASFSKIALEVPQILKAISQLTSQGLQVFYIIGNHDIVLEHFLEDWGAIKVSPFLNLTSGQQRIRIEHGHIYDPFFVGFPRIYEVCTFIGGLFLKISPSIYRIWIQFERWRYRNKNQNKGIKGENPSFIGAAEELCRRGFDTIIFGHTHHPGEKDLPSGGKYFNSGSWMRQSHYILVDNGQVSLKKFMEEV